MNFLAVAGDFSYGSTHLISIAVLISVIVLLCCVFRKASLKTKRNLIIVLSVVALAFELGWRILWLYRGASFKSLYPFYLCNFAGIIIPIFALINKKLPKTMFYAFAFIGGIITFVYPQGIFVESTLNLGIAKSILQHSFIIIIPVLEYVFGLFRPKIQQFGWTVLGMSISYANGFFMPMLFKDATDYVYLTAGLPFTIAGVPQFLILAPFALLIMFLFGCALNPSGTKEMFKKFRTKKQS